MQTAASKRRVSKKRNWKAVLLVRNSEVALERGWLRGAAKKILNGLDAGPLPPGINEITILLTDDSEIRALNAAYRGKDEPTDVLTFCQPQSPPLPRPSALLGEIAISVETAARQAKTDRVGLKRELTRLIIHGILHLFGYEHEKVSAAKAREMRRLERELIKATNDIMP